MRKNGKERDTHKTDADALSPRRIRSAEDLRVLVQCVIPQRLRTRVLHADSLGNIHDAAVILMRMLWSNGGCPPVERDQIITRINKEDAWQISRFEDRGVTQEILRERLRQRLARVRKSMTHAGWDPYARIVSTGKHGRLLQLVVDPSLLNRICPERSVVPPGVEILVCARHYEQNLPLLTPGQQLRCEVVSRITGYLHLFHVNASAKCREIFPVTGGVDYVVKTERVKRNEVCRVPGDILYQPHGWTIEREGTRSSLRNTIIAFVTRKNVHVGVSDVSDQGWKVQKETQQTRALRFSEGSFRDLTPAEFTCGSSDFLIRQ